MPLGPGIAISVTSGATKDRTPIGVGAASYWRGHHAHHRRDRRGVSTVFRPSIATVADVGASNTLERQCSNTKIDVKPASQQLSKLRDDVDDLLARLAAAESLWSWWLIGVATQNRSSARNMLHYWAIRQCDLRDLQARLAAYGLSSLGRSEPHVEATLLLVRSAICAMLGDAWQQPRLPGASVEDGPELLRYRTQQLLGPEPVDRVTRIMVTLPSSAATDPRLGSRVSGTRSEHRTHQLCA